MIDIEAGFRRVMARFPRIMAALRRAELREQVRDALKNSPEGPDFGKMSHAERDEYLFGPSGILRKGKRK